MDPKSGRFGSVDPWAGDPQTPFSLHRYLYANASPVSFVDPSGETPLWLITAQLYTGCILSTIVGKVAFSAFLGASASGLGYGASVLLGKLNSPEKSYSELWSTQDFLISTSSGAVTNLVLEIKVVAKLGVVFVNVSMGAATGAAIRQSSGTPTSLSDILADVVVGYAVAAIGGKGDNTRLINAVRGLMSGPGGVIVGAGASSVGRKAIETMEELKEMILDGMEELEKSLWAAYGIPTP